MISKLFGAVFAPKYPRRYTGRHRASYVPQRRAEAAAAKSHIVVGLEATA